MIPELRTPHSAFRTSPDVERTSFEKLRIQRNANFDPERVAKFVHSLKSHVELANLKGLYDETKEMVPEMRGPTFEGMMSRVFG